MKYFLSQDERMALLRLLPFHGEEKYRRLYDESRTEIGFDEDEIKEWGKFNEKKFEIGDVLKEKIMFYLEEIEFPTDIQKGLIEKLK